MSGETIDEIADRICKRAREELLAGLERKRLAQQTKPGLVVCSEAELSLETQRGRLRDAAERLFEEEKRQLESAAERNRRWIEERKSKVLNPPPLTKQEAYQQSVDNWVRFQRQAAAYERRFRKELDPLNLGIYGVEPFHGGEND